MKKVINKKVISYMLSFIIPIFMISMYIFIKEIISHRQFFFNGDNFLVADMKYQYNYLFSYMHNVLSGNDSLLYSFYSGLGSNMVSTIGYYLASPFNLLYGLVSKADFPFLTVIIHMLKLGLCSLFMNCLLNDKYGCKWTNLFFSIAYAFIGFNSIYYFNYMWTDVIYMTPLVIMGIDKLIDKKPLLYIITLSLVLIFNFYMAYILGVFCVIYFLYELFKKYEIKETKKYKKIVLIFIVSSLLSIGLSSFFLIPLIFNMHDMMRFPIEQGSLNLDFHNYGDKLIFQIFSNIYLGSKGLVDMVFRERPVIYISVFSFMLSILYFFNKKIKVKEKILSGIVIFIFLLSFMIPHLQLVWQGFSFPNGYVDRFSYLYSFFMLLLAAKQFYSMEKLSFKKTIIFILIYNIFSIFIIFKKLAYLKTIHILICMELFVGYIILYYLYQRVKSKASKIISLLVFLIVIFESIYNYSEVKILSNQYNPRVTSYSFFSNEICDKLNNIDTQFYRLEGSFKISNLDSHLCRVHGVSNEISTNDKDVYSFMYRNGQRITYIFIAYDYWKLPILDSILGVKYLTSYNEQNFFNYKLRKEYKIDDSSSYANRLYVYENPYALNLGFAIDDKFSNNYQKDNGDRLANLNNLVKSLSGIKEDILSELPIMEDENGDKYYYVDRDIDKIYLTMDYKISKKTSTHGNLYINNYPYNELTDYHAGTEIINGVKKGHKLKLDIKNNIDINKINLYYFDEENFKKAISNLKQHQLKNVKTKGNKMTADISLNKDSTVLLTIPHDKGWKIYVDGKQTSYKKLADTFIGIDMKKGYHKLKMKFYPRGMILGILTSILSTLILIIYLKKYFNK